MLQLPTPTAGAGRFTSAQIAEISRGAVIKAVKPRTRPDYILSRLGAFELALLQFQAADKAMSEAKAILEPSNAIIPKIWPSRLEPAIRTFSGPFYHERQIRDAIRKHRRWLLDSRKEDRKRGFDPSDQMARERKQRFDSYGKALKNLPAGEMSLLKAMQIETRRVRKLQSNIKYAQKEQKWLLANTQMHKALLALHWEKSVSRAGAIATIRLAKLLLDNEIRSAHYVSRMLEHVRVSLLKLDVRP